MQLEDKTKNELIIIIGEKEEQIKILSDLARTADLEKINLDQLHAKVIDDNQTLLGQLANTETSLHEAIAAKTKQEGELMAVIQELQEQLVKTEQTVTGPATVSLTDAAGTTRSFVVNCPHFIYQGQKHHAASLTSNSPILRELVEQGAGILTEITN